MSATACGLARQLIVAAQLTLIQSRHRGRCVRCGLAALPDEEAGKETHNTCRIECTCRVQLVLDGDSVRDAMPMTRGRRQGKGRIAKEAEEKRSEGKCAPTVTRGAELKDARAALGFKSGAWGAWLALFWSIAAMIVGCAAFLASAAAASMVVRFAAPRFVMASAWA